MSRPQMEAEDEKHFIARLGMDNFFAVFYTHPNYKNTYDYLYDGNTRRNTHRELIMECFREFSTRNEQTGAYLLEHFSTDIKITRPLHSSRDTDTHFNIEGKNGNYHIFTNKSGHRITRITYMVHTVFPF